MLGQTRQAAMKQFKFSVQGSLNLDRKLQKLKSCCSNHFSLPDAPDKQFLANFISYLGMSMSYPPLLKNNLSHFKIFSEWLVAVEPMSEGVPSKSVLLSLNHLCKNHWNDSKTSLTSPATLSTQQNVAERQFQWTVLTTRASMQSWEDIETLFITKVRICILKFIFFWAAF